MGKPELASFPKENDGDGRYYKHPHTGEKLPSVTSVLRLADKSQLTQWAVNLVVDWAVNNLDKLYGQSVEQGIRSARYRWKDVRDERAQVGTGVHETIEAEHTGSWDYPELDAEQLQIMEQWRDLNKHHVIKPILSEYTVWRDGCYAGTADGFWEIDGVKCLVDIKTSKNTWPEHFYQLAALWNAPKYLAKEGDEWKEYVAPKYDKVAIVHLRADKWEIIYIDDLSENCQAFNGYLQVWQAKQKIAANEKARELLTPGFV